MNTLSLGQMFISAQKYTSSSVQKYTIFN